jgi:hypothetical protein
MLKVPKRSVDVFLRFMFQFARRPDPLLLKETAAVVRYLCELERRGVPRSVANSAPAALRKYHASAKHQKDAQKKQVLSRVASVLWEDLAIFGDIEQCGKQKALALLKRHEATYLAGLANLPWRKGVRQKKESVLKSAKKLLDEFEIPSLQLNEPDPFQPPTLMSGLLTAHSEVVPRQQDDVSERIYFAFHALERSQVKLSRERIANALVKARVPRRRAKGPWDYGAVNDTIQAYRATLRRHLLKKFGTTGLKRRIEEWRESQVDKWIGLFLSTTSRSRP